MEQGKREKSREREKVFGPNIGYQRRAFPLPTLSLTRLLSHPIPITSSKPNQRKKNLRNEKRKTRSEKELRAGCVKIAEKNPIYFEEIFIGFRWNLKRVFSSFTSLHPASNEILFIAAINDLSRGMMERAKEQPKWWARENTLREGRCIICRVKTISELERGT